LSFATSPASSIYGLGAGVIIEKAPGFVIDEVLAKLATLIEQRQKERCFPMRHILKTVRT